MTHTQVIHAYGTFMVSWSVLESVLEVAIMKQLKISELQAAIVTSSLGFRARSTILSSLLNLHGDEYSEAVKVLNKITQNAKRNTFVHGHIFVGEQEKLTFVKADVNQKYRAKRVTLTAVELYLHVLEINSSVAVLQKLLAISDDELNSFAKIGFNASTTSAE